MGSLCKAKKNILNSHPWLCWLTPDIPRCASAKEVSEWSGHLTKVKSDILG